MSKTATNSIILVFLIMLSWPSPSYGQNLNSNDFHVSFGFDKDGSHLVIKPTCLNKTNKEVVLRYKVDFRKVSKNQSKDKHLTQSGILQLSPGEEKVVCKMEVPAPGQDGYILGLYLYKKGSRIGVYSVSRQPQDQ